MMARAKMKLAAMVLGVILAGSGVVSVVADTPASRPNAEAKLEASTGSSRPETPTSESSAKVKRLPKAVALELISALMIQGDVNRAVELLDKDAERKGRGRGSGRDESRIHG